LPPGIDLNNGTYWLTLSNALATNACGLACPVYWDEDDGPSAARENADGSISSEAFTLYGVPLKFSPVLLDPVDSGYLDGPQITTSTALLSQGGRVITNVAADGTTQALIQITANSQQEVLTVSVLDENGQPTNDVTNCGGLFPLGGNSQSAGTSITLTTDNTSMAFAIYVPPVNFARGAQDYSLGARAFSVQVKPSDLPDDTVTANASLLRPPVVVVHGLWSKPADWSNFTPLVSDSRFVVQYVDYSDEVPGVIGTDPVYLTLYVPKSAVGFSYNSTNVDGQIRGFIVNFKRNKSAAAVTADVVAHSMGGDIVRTIALGSGFQSNDTYGHGPVDKLITIGTPHLGTPLATQLVQDDANACFRLALSLAGNGAFRSVYTNNGYIKARSPTLRAMALEGD